MQLVSKRLALPEGTYIETVRSLFSTLLTTIIMGVSFVAVGLLVQSKAPDLVFGWLLALGSVAAALRLLVLVLYGRRAADESLAVDDARRLERRFAAAYLSFAIIFGAFTARGMTIAEPEMHTVLIGLLFGYGAGVASGLALRPWISIAAISIAVVPTIIMSLLADHIAYRAAGVLLALFLVGGLYSIIGRYRVTVRGITMRQLFMTLARHDPLTGLPNRLSLREHFGAAASRRAAGAMVAVHCLDLDRFKPVNDRLGHPAGDALLKAVAHRLTGVLREGDIAARTGGDEFIVIQSGIRHDSEAEVLAHRIVKAVAQPYSIEGHPVTIGTSVGYALSPRDGTDLDRVATLADEALIAVKRTGRSVGAYDRARPDAARLSA